jgi:transposase InsO family protein
MYQLDLEAIQAEIERAGHGNKSAVVLKYADRFGISKDSIYRALRREFGKKKNLKRLKRHNQDLIDMIAQIKMKGIGMGLGDREVATEICIGMLRDQGVDGAECLTVSTVNRRLEESGFRIRDPKVRVEADYANQEHQLDFSRSKYFQLTSYDHNAGDYLLKVSGRELHYKKGDRRLRTWLAQLKDSHSRCRLSVAYAATSEDGLIGLDALNYCWQRPPDDHPMRHVPDMLKTDQGSFHKRKEVKSVMQALGIRLRNSGAYNHDSQGKIESGFASLWRQFELPLAIKMGDGAKIYLSEYNELLHEFMTINDAKKKHPILDDTREATYRKSILKHQPREVDEDILRIACRVETRLVRQDLMVSLNGEPFEAPVYAMDKNIRVYKNLAGEVMGELQEEDRKTFILKPFQFRQMDDFSHRPHLTYRQEIEGRAQEKPAIDGKRIFMPAKTRKVEVESPFMKQTETHFATIYQARVYVGEQLRAYGYTYNDLSDVFDPLLEEDLSKVSIDEVINEIKDSPNKMRLAL